MASTTDPAVVAMMQDIEFLTETIEMAKAQRQSFLLITRLQDVREDIKREYTAWTGVAYIEPEAPDARRQ